MITTSSGRDKFLVFAVFCRAGLCGFVLKNQANLLPGKSIQGASTTGYMYFAINKEDPAPYLVYKPAMFRNDSTYWISLR